MDVKKKSLLALAVLVATALLAACSANSGPQTSLGSPLSNKGSPPVVTLAISPESVDVGQTAVATWSSSGATNCSALGAWSGSMPLDDGGGQAIGPFTTPGTYSYSIVCTGSGGSAVATQIVTVGNTAAPTIQFDLDPATIAPGSSVAIIWSSTNATSCVASGGTGADGWLGNQPTVNQSGFNTGAIQTPGQYTYDLTCVGSGGSTQATHLLTVSASAPAAPPILTFSGTPTLVAPGQATSFSWSSGNATSCAASGGTGSDAWTGAQPIASAGFSSGPLSTLGSYSFTLTCTGGGGMVAKSLTINVSNSTQPPAVAVNIDVTPTQITAGSAATLHWSTSNADSCSASGSWSGPQPLLGSNVSTGTLIVPGIYSFSLTCTGAGGSTGGTATLNVTAPAASVLAFDATPNVISTGGSTLLTWVTLNATSCTASGGTGSDGWAGLQPANNVGLNIGPFSAAGTYLYTLVCTGPGGTGAPQSLTVTVNNPAQPPASVTVFAALPSSILVGQSAMLNWVSLGATSCVASGGTGNDGWNGSVGTASIATSTGPINTAGSYTYRLTCSGTGGAGSPSSVVVNVSNLPPAPASITSFTVTPGIIQSGQAAILVWTSSGATSCAASGGTGSDGWNGSAGTSSTGTSTGAIGTAGIYIYTLNCSGPGGNSLPGTAILNVTAAPPTAAAVLTFSATPPLLISGQSTSLAWTTINATSCSASGGTGSDGWSGPVAISSAGTSTGAINTAGIYTYTLTCTGAGGSAGPSSVIVVVTPAPTLPASIIAFTVLPSTIQAGQSALLTWITSGATSCNATGGTGSDGWNGSVPTSGIGQSTGAIATASSYTYTLNCSGPGGPSAPSSVVLNVNNVPPVPPLITLLTALPSTVQTGGSTLLTWASIGATSCTASGGSGGDNWTGSHTPISTLLVGPINAAGNFVYTLTCTGLGGASIPVSVTVDVNATPPPPVINSFSISPIAIQTGQTVTALWSTTGAATCTATGGAGSDGWSGSMVTQSSGTTIGPIGTAGLATYILTCSGAGGTSLPSTARVLITALAPPAAIVSFTANPVAIQAGQSTSLSWTTSNASSCTASGGTGSDGWTGTVATSNAGISTGAIGAAGAYTYILTCAGAGGSSLPAVAPVVVSILPAPPTVISFVASPNTLLVGQSTSFSWSTSSASACAAGGGTGSDGWSGSVTLSSSGLTVGPFNNAGVYAYTLLCTGPGGIGLPASLSVTVTHAPPAATITAFSATPNSISAGGSTLLAWSSGNATSCTATGGAGSDGWSGTQAPANISDSVGPLSAGSYTYTLTCSGPGGASAPSSATVTVTPAAPSPPTVSLLINGSSSAQIQPGALPVMSWSTANATSCTASGGAGIGAWVGAQPISSNGLSLAAVTVAGVYSYTLTCAGPGGTGSSTATLTVIASTSFDCNVPGIQTTALTAPAASITTHKGGLCLLGCSISNAGNIIDSAPGNFAGLVIPLGLAGSLTLDVNGATSFPAGRKAGFILANGNTLLSVGLLKGITIQTLLNGVVQETAATGTVLTLQAAGLLTIDPEAGFAEFTTSKPFDSLQMSEGSLVSLDSNVRVYGACVSLQ